MKKVVFLVMVVFLVSCKSMNISELKKMKPITIFAIADRYKDRKKYKTAIKYYNYVKQNFSMEKYPVENLEVDYNIGLIFEKTFKKKLAVEYFQKVVDVTAENDDMPQSFKILAEKRIFAIDHKKKSYATDESGEESGEKKK